MKGRLSPDVPDDSLPFECVDVCVLASYYAVDRTCAFGTDDVDAGGER